MKISEDMIDSVWPQAASYRSDGLYDVHREEKQVLSAVVSSAPKKGN